ncbi:MAG: hypothetical protein U0746_06690 [Gemmataceae bacterium]
MTSAPPTAGGTELLSYRAYRGLSRGPASAVWAIARSGLVGILRRKLFWGLFAAAVMIFLFFFFSLYLMSWVESQAGEQSVPFMGGQVKPADMLGFFRKSLKLDDPARLYRNVIWYEGYVVMIVLALAGSVLVGNDFRFGSLPFYLSKPIGRWHYVGGKCLAVAIFTNLLTTFFAACLWVENGLLEGWAYFWDGRNHLVGLVGYGAVLTVVFSLLLVATAGWVRKTVPMVMVWTALFVFARTLGENLVRFTDQPRWRLVDLWSDAYVLGNWCLGMPGEGSFPAPGEAAMVLGGVCLACLIYLNRRIRAVEIV